MIGCQGDLRGVEVLTDGLIVVQVVLLGAYVEYQVVVCPHDGGAQTNHCCDSKRYFPIERIRAAWSPIDWMRIPKCSPTLTVSPVPIG